MEELNVYKENVVRAFEAADENTIKKELYQQQPVALYGYDSGGCRVYSCEVVIDGTEVEITFSIPFNEAIFGNQVAAQLLIPWIK